MTNHLRTSGIYAALTSAFFLGLTPVFGRQAILLGMSPIAVVAIRTILATVLLLIVMFLFYRRYFYIYPAGLLGCMIAGWTNGIGSLFYYSSLGTIEAGLGQLLYSLYPLFLLIWLTLDKQPPSRLTILRLLLALPAIFLLTQTKDSRPDWIGVAFMLIASILYALHLPINQRVLFDMPAPTVTLYTLIAMSSVVVPAFLILDAPFLQAKAILATPTFQPTFFQDVRVLFENGLQEIHHVAPYIWPVIGLTLVTFLSRLTLFQGVKKLGGMQTAFLGLSELLVTLVFAHLWLNESLSIQQWIGAVVLIVSLAMVGLEKSPPKKLTTGGFLSWLRPAGLHTDSWQPHD